MTPTDIRNKEKLLVDECMMFGRSVAVDNTNPTEADRMAEKDIFPLDDYFPVEEYFEN